MSFLRLGKYRGTKSSGKTLNEYSERHADFMAFETNYLIKRDIIELTKATKLKFSFKYTEQYYWNKIRSIFGCSCIYKYPTPNFILDSLLFSVCVRVASITLVLEKDNKYIDF